MGRMRGIALVLAREQHLRQDGGLTGIHQGCKGKTRSQHRERIVGAIA